MSVTFSAFDSVFELGVAAVDIANYLTINLCTGYIFFSFALIYLFIFGFLLYLRSHVNVNGCMSFGCLLRSVCLPHFKQHLLAASFINLSIILLLGKKGFPLAACRISLIERANKICKSTIDCEIQSANLSISAARTAGAAPRLPFAPISLTHLASRCARALGNLWLRIRFTNNIRTGLITWPGHSLRCARSFSILRLCLPKQ